MIFHQHSDWWKTSCAGKGGLYDSAVLSAISPSNSLSGQSAHIRRLWLAENGEEAWHAIILPWLRLQTTRAWRESRPTVLLTPTRAHGFYLHSRIVESGLNLAAIHFWTPADVRLNLLNVFPGTGSCPSPEAARVFAAMAAQEVADKDPDNRTAVAILNEPDSFVRTAEQLAAAGWDLAEVADPPVRAVVRRWRELFRAYHFHTPQEVDTALLAKSEDRAVIASLLITGFDGTHWPVWPILQAAALTADNCTVALTAPRLDWEEPDQIWIGTWENRFGPAEPAAQNGTALPERAHPYRALQEALHARSETSFSGSVDFFLARGVREEAHAIVHIALRYLPQAECLRLGIVFPGACPLAREVAALLEQAGICCSDGFGFDRPGPFERGDWRSWLDLQQAPGLARLLEFVEWLDLAALGFPPDWSDHRTGMEAALREAFREVLIDDLGVLAAWLRNSRHRGAPAALRLIELVSVLPATGLWREFLTATLEAHRRLGWSDRAERLEWLAKKVTFLSEAEVSRAVFLRWLGSVAITSQKERAPENNHRYSRVHLLSYAEAEKQVWSHAILTSLSEGVWPPSSTATGFLSGNEVARLNRSLRRLERGAVREGNQGEGHLTLEEGKGLCFGALERRLLAESQTSAILENVSHALALTARISDEGGQTLAPSEFLSRIYRLTTGKILDDAAVEAGSSPEETVKRLPGEGKVPAGEITAMVAAYRARRDRSQPFGPFEFGWSAEPVRPAILSCGDWEKALKSPAAVWMRYYLGVHPREAIAAEALFHAARGTWSHRWLAGIAVPRSNAFFPWPEPEHLVSLMEEQTLATKNAVESILRQCGRELPLWWISLWQEARYQARDLLALLEPAREWSGLSTEYVVPATPCDFLEGALPPLQLHGRIDLLMARELAPEGSLPPDLWLVDFKTGTSSRALSVRDLLKGKGIQLALYALALSQCGAASVQASLLRVGESLGSPMKLDQITALSEAWAELQRMQAGGTFGQLGELRPEFQNTSAYPLATLEIDPEILEEKWVLSHPGWSGAV